MTQGMLNMEPDLTEASCLKGERWVNFLWHRLVICACLMSDELYCSHSQRWVKPRDTRHEKHDSCAARSIKGSPHPSSRRIRRHYTRGRAGRGGERVILRVTNCTHADRVRAADALESPCRRSRARNCRPRRRHRDNRGGQGLLLGVCLDILHTLARRGGTSSGIKTPGWSSLGKTTRHFLTPPRSHRQSLPLFFVTHFHLHC